MWNEHSSRNYKLKRATITVLALRKVLPLALLCLLASISISACLAQQSAQGATESVQRGSTLPIYLQPEALTEANKPTVELAEGSSFWHPGSERFYGYALRDLRDYLQKSTGAQYPLTAVDANAKSGIFAGTFAQFPNFKSQQAAAQKAMASSDPEAFVVEAQGNKLFILGKSNLGSVSYTHLTLPTNREV